MLRKIFALMEKMVNSFVFRRNNCLVEVFCLRQVFRFLLQSSVFLSEWLGLRISREFRGEKEKISVHWSIVRQLSSGKSMSLELLFTDKCNLFIFNW